jgi:hypothetical protein
MYGEELRRATATSPEQGQPPKWPMDEEDWLVESSKPGGPGST